MNIINETFYCQKVLQYLLSINPIHLYVQYVPFIIYMTSRVLLYTLDDIHICIYVT